MSDPRSPQEELRETGYGHGRHEDGQQMAGEAQAVSNDGDEQVSIVDLLILLAKHKLLIVGLPLVAAVVAVIYSLLLPNVYTARTNILPPQQSQSGSAMALLSQLGGVGGGLAGSKGAGDVYVAMLRSRTVADNLIQRFDLMNLYRAKYPSQARAQLAGAVDILAGRDGLITIEVVDTVPKRAAEIANAFVDELMKLTQVLAVTEASQRRLFFEQQFLQAKVNLGKSEAAAKQALANGGVFKVDEQGRTMLESTARLRAEITVKEVQIGAMRTFASDENPELRLVQREIESMRRELAKIEGEGNGLGRAASGSGKGLDGARLLRDVKYNETVYELLAKQYEIAKIDEAKESSVIQVLDRAVEPDVKSGPKRLRMVEMSVLGAFLLAVLAAFVREALVRARRSPRQMNRFAILKRHLSWR